MDIESILNMQVAIGHGTNNFTMSRGSFNYKEKIDWTRKLVSVSSEETKKQSEEKTISLLFRDPKSGDEYPFAITEEIDGRIHVRLNRHIDENFVNRFRITFSVRENEHFYGCGETFSEFDLRGQKVRIWTAEHQNAKRISKKIIRDRLTGKHPDKKYKFDKYESYYVQPTFVSGDRYFVHVNTNSFSVFDFTKSPKGLCTLCLQEAPDIYIDRADSFEELSLKLSGLLGKQKSLPDWVYDGVILASQEGTESVEKKIEIAEKNNIPVSGFWSQDWCGCRRTGFGYQVMWNWEYDGELYPNLDEKIKEWNEKGIHFLGYINPFMALEKELYKFASEKGYCVKNKDGSDYLVTITTFPAAMIDLTNPEAYNWYKQVIKTNMIELGMSGWMADFGEYLPTDCVLFDGSKPEKRHNEWPAIWAKLNSEAVAESGKEGIFFFTRAGYTESIKYSPVMWNGDQHVDFSVDDGIGSVIPATLSLAMSGFTITHSDIGGYTTIMNMTRNRELLLRWEEMNVFSPIYRFHEGNQPSRNIQFADDDILLKHLAKCVRMHIILKDYIKESVEEAYKKGIPVMRPVFYHYDEEWAYTARDEYLLGRDILVAPVLKEKADKREVMLPQDDWVHLLTQKEYTGGRYVVEAPVGNIPVFIRKESKWFELAEAFALLQSEEKK